MLQAHAFGKLRFGHETTILAQFPTRQVEELFGFLLLRPEVRHPREKLITLLWPDILEAEGRPRFSIVLSRLRQMFKQLQTPFSNYVETTREWVMFDPQRPFTFDRDQFVNACRQGFRAESDENREALLQTAVSLYRADLMEGIYAEWCLAEREHLARLRLRALGQLMHGAMQRQAYPAAIEQGHAILQDDPLREETHRALMTCYAAQNRHDLAARQYEQYLHLLQAELNVPPLPATTDLYRQIMESRARAALHSAAASPQQKAALQTALTAFQQAAQHLNNLL